MNIMRGTVARVFSLPRACGKMELELKFQLLFGSCFLFRLVRSVTKVPFVVSFNTSVVLRQLFFSQKQTSGAFIHLFSVPCRPREQSCVSSNSKDFMSDERKIGNEKINYSVGWGK